MSLPATQRTLAAPVSRRGRGLFGGREATVTLRPAEQGANVRLRRTDLPGGPAVALSPDILTEADRHTAVRVGDGTIAMTEHLLAALMGLGIDNVLVELDAEEMPCLDGSALAFAEAILEAGIVEQAAEAVPLTPAQPIEVAEGPARLRIEPAEGLRVEYTLDYGAQYVGRQTVRFEITPETFLREIAPARTYALRPEVEAFLARGLGGGATEENVVVLEKDGSAAPALRFPDECCRHKVVDLLGDLRLAGGRLNASVSGVGSGHALNHALARRLVGQCAP